MSIHHHQWELFQLDEGLAAYQCSCGQVRELKKIENDLIRAMELSAGTNDDAVNLTLVTSTGFKTFCSLKCALSFLLSEVRKAGQHGGGD